MLRLRFEYNYCEPLIFLPALLEHGSISPRHRASEIKQTLSYHYILSRREGLSCRLIQTLLTIVM